jgi:archaellum biogenesis protein FlaJ (TadC family)
VISWFGQYQEVFAWLALSSLITFVISLLSLPWLVARIPEDYFLHNKRHPAPLKQNHPVIRMALLIGKNVLGVILLAGGIIMLFIPGQGLLTIAMGMLLMDYPGKFGIERRLARNDNVLNGLNWLRARARALPLQVDEDQT